MYEIMPITLIIIIVQRKTYSLAFSLFKLFSRDFRHLDTLIGRFKYYIFYDVYKWERKNAIDNLIISHLSVLFSGCFFFGT